MYVYIYTKIYMNDNNKSLINMLSFKSLSLMLNCYENL